MKFSLNLSEDYSEMAESNEIQGINIDGDFVVGTFCKILDNSLDKESIVFSINNLSPTPVINSIYVSLLRDSYSEVFLTIYIDSESRILALDNVRIDRWFYLIIKRINNDFRIYINGKYCGLAI